MTTPSLHDQLKDLDYGPAPTPFAISDVIHAGQRARSRRRLARSTAGVLAVAAVLAAGVAVPLAIRGNSPKRLNPASSPEVTPPYWHTRFTETVTITQNGEKVNHDPNVASEGWEGNDRSSWTVPKDPSKPQIEGPAYQPFVGKRVTWDYLWALPTTEAPLREALQSQYQTPDSADFAAAVFNLIFEPGPDAVKLAAAHILADTPDVTSGTGTDEKGRTSRIFTIHFPTGQTMTAFLDPTTGRMLEEVSRSTGTSGNIPEVNVTTLVWDQIGPTQDHNSIPTGP